MQICYNKPSKFVFAASRDRSLYGWQWPIEEDEPSDELTVVSEPSTVLHGHSLGVTALDTSDGKHYLGCVVGSRDVLCCSNIQHILSCCVLAQGITPFAFGI